MCLGEGYTSRNPGGLRRGALILTHPLDVLGLVADGREIRRILRDIISGIQGVTQGDPLSPTIFNVVVDAVVRHWVEEMAEGAGGQGVRR